MKQIILNDVHLEEEDLFLFEFSRKDALPDTAIGARKHNDGSASVTLDIIKHPTEREICEIVDPVETQSVLFLHFYRPESIDVLIEQASKAKEMLMRQEVINT